MAPINLFFGVNSSGKSIIGQFLMMLRQTMDSSDRKAVFYPGDTNTPVHLGSYQEMVYKRDLKNHISFEYVWELEPQLTIKDRISGQSFSGNEMMFSAEIGMRGSSRRRSVLSLKDMWYGLLTSGVEVLNLRMRLRDPSKAEYEFISESYPFVRKPGRAWSFSPPDRFYGFTDQVVAYHQNADFVQDFNLRHENLFRRLYYLGPLRMRPERLYSWAGTEPESVGFSGEHTVAAMLAARVRKISLGYKKRSQYFEELIANELYEMGLIYDFDIKAISKGRSEYELKIKTLGSEDWVDLPDVGFGISQVLPVLVQCYYAPQGSIIIVEQPEIHLHPNAQATLADVLINVINSREDGIDRNIQLIIETHSEHFLRRLQRRIAEGKIIDEDKVSAYFADVSKKTAHLEPLEIDEYGNILNWPENFFGDEMGDVTAQAKAALQRRIKQAKGSRG